MAYNKKRNTSLVLYNIEKVVYIVLGVILIVVAFFVIKKYFW